MIIKLVFAFGAGFISFLTPCVLPIIPGYISYITGKNLNEIEQDKKQPRFVATFARSSDEGWWKEKQIKSIRR